MNTTEVQRRVKSLEREIRENEALILVEGKKSFGISRDQISDSADIWSAEEIVLSQVFERNQRIKRLQKLKKDKHTLLTLKLKKVCFECGDIIPSKRISVIPNTLTCIDCQQSREERSNSLSYTNQLSELIA